MDRGSKVLVMRSAFFSLVGVNLSNVVRGQFQNRRKRNILGLSEREEKIWDREISEMSSALVHVSTSHSKCGAKLICFCSFCCHWGYGSISKIIFWISVTCCLQKQSKSEGVIDTCLSRHSNFAIIYDVSHILIQKQNTTNPTLDSFRNYCS